MPKTAQATPNQAYALALAVYRAYRGGWNGEVRKRRTRPYLRPNERFGVERGTGAMVHVPSFSRGGFLVNGQQFHSLVAKGLVNSSNGWLTHSGIATGEACFAAIHERTAEQAAQAHMLEQQVKEQEVQDKIQRAKHLFRGLKVTREVGGSKKVSDSIGRNGLPNNFFWLDDLIAVGEEIEKLR